MTYATIFTRKRAVLGALALVAAVAGSALRPAEAIPSFDGAWSVVITTEAGGTATFTVVLNTQPSADVTIALTSSDTTEGTVNPASLTFTAANFNVAQTVTVTGVNDDLDDGNIPYSIVTAPAPLIDATLNEYAWGEPMCGSPSRLNRIRSIAFASVALLGTWGAVQKIPPWIGGMPSKTPKAIGVSQILSGCGAIIGCLISPALAAALSRRTARPSRSSGPGLVVSTVTA